MSHSIINDVTPEMIAVMSFQGHATRVNPTVPVWSKGQFHDDYVQCLQEESLKDRPISLYVHLPFCRQLCTFYGCNKLITNNKEITEDYLSALDKEIDGVSKILESHKKIAQIHLGGGTPTYLNPKQLERIIK